MNHLRHFLFITVCVLAATGIAVAQTGGSAAQADSNGLFHPLGDRVAQTRSPAAAQTSGAAAAQPSGFPWQNESLRYTMNWQSGLSVGDGSLSAHKGDNGWEFEASVNAGVPGFAVNDKIHASSTLSLCSTELERDFNHAGKKTREKTTFDQKAGSADRVTLFPDGGDKPGKSTFEIPSCARDALTFLYYARVELGQGRMVPAQKVFFGSAYNVKMEYTGAQDLVVDKKTTVTDHLVVTVKGPKSDFHFEVFYARDAARTPLQIRVPLSMGTFTLDLVR